MLRSTGPDSVTIFWLIATRGLPRCGKINDPVLFARHQYGQLHHKGKSPAARSRLAGFSPHEIACLSVITEAELLYGLAKSASGEQRRQSLPLFLTRLKVHAWGREAAAAYGILRAKQEAMGQTLGSLDMQIAAHAIALRAVLVTSDKAFQQVPDLAGLENWAMDL